MTNSDFESKHPRVTGGPSAGQFAVAAKNEADLGAIDLSAVAHRQTENQTENRDRIVTPAECVGTCPDCGNPMIGKIGTQPGGGDSSGGAGDLFAPGSSCEFCPHEVADLVYESEPDDDGRSYEFRLESDGTIRITDEDGDTTEVADFYSADWDGLNIFGVDKIALRRAVEYNDDTYMAMSDACDAAGLYDMSGAFGIIIDRGTVPAPALMALDAETIRGLYEEHIGPAVDAVEDDFAAVGSTTGSGGDSSLSYEARYSIREACAEAGLGSMSNFYSFLEDRDAISEEAALALNVETVTAHYEQHVAPAIDQLEGHLISEVRGGAGRNALAETSEAVERLGGDATVAQALAEISARFEQHPNLGRLTGELEGVRDDHLPGRHTLNGEQARRVFGDLDRIIHRVRLVAGKMDLR